VERYESDRVAWSGIGALAAIAVAGLLVPVRSTIDNTNVALILVLVIVAAATFGGRTAGAVTSIVSALAFNYFQTEPYYTLRISDRDDIVSAVLLLIVGLAVGEIAVLSRRRGVVAIEHVTGAHQLEQVAALLAQGASEDQVWEAVRDGIVVELGLESCHFEPGSGLRRLPRIERDGRLLEGEKYFTGGGFALPAEGAEILVEREGVAIGRLVLEPTTGRAISREQRRVAVALADSFAVVVGRSGAPRAYA
jgi:K+-sensing histidine kinase KdpD